MDAVTSGRRQAGPHGDRGFTLVEALVAMLVLTVALLSLAKAFAIGLTHMSTSSANLVAREKAREAVESVHSARDTRTILWAEIKNVSNGGIFLDGPVNLNAAGVDGLINTADDAAAGLETQRGPGLNGILGDADDTLTPLTGFKRRVEIRELSPVNPALREVVITITYTVGPLQRTYTLRTFVSSFS